MKIYITGISGTGKTSLSRVLKGRGINAIDIDEISHWENKVTKERVGWEPGSGDEWMLAHDWVCDLVKLKDLISQSDNSVVLGHASNQEAYLSLFDKMFTLKCKPETIVHRIQSRTDNDYGKHPDDMARILEWQKGFDLWMVEKGAEVLDGEKPTDELASYIISLLSQ